MVKLYHSDNLLVSMLAKRCLYQCVSNMSKNVTCIDKELDFIKYIKFAERVNTYLISLVL